MAPCIIVHYDAATVCYRPPFSESNGGRAPLSGPRAGEPPRAQRGRSGLRAWDGESVAQSGWLRTTWGVNRCPAASVQVTKLRPDGPPQGQLVWAGARARLYEDACLGCGRPVLRLRGGARDHEIQISLTSALLAGLGSTGAGEVPLSGTPAGVGSKVQVPVTRRLPALHRQCNHHFLFWTTNLLLTSALLAGLGSTGAGGVPLWGPQTGTLIGA